MEVRVDVRTVEGVAVVSVSGELDVYTSPQLRSAIDDILARGQTRMLINLAETTYMDSTTLSILSSALKRLQDVGGNLGVIYDQPLMDRLFTVTGLNLVLPNFRSEADALTAARTWTRASPGA